MPTFGPIENTIPPGVVCDIGAVSFPEGSATPIQFIRFESQRVVIDIAGPSSTIGVVFEHHQQILATVAVPDGSAAMVTPARVLDYSEISGRFAHAPEALLSPALRAVLKRALGAETEGGEILLAPAVRARL